MLVIMLGIFARAGFLLVVFLVKGLWFKGFCQPAGVRRTLRCPPAASSFLRQGTYWVSGKIPETGSPSVQPSSAESPLHDQKDALQPFDRQKSNFRLRMRFTTTGCLATGLACVLEKMLSGPRNRAGHKNGGL